eukprot:1364223-Prymnesium_polylepis.1
MQKCDCNRDESGAGCVVWVHGVGIRLLRPFGEESGIGGSGISRGLSAGTDSEQRRMACVAGRRGGRWGGLGDHVLLRAGM